MTVIAITLSIVLCHECTAHVESRGGEYVSDRCRAGLSRLGRIAPAFDLMTGAGVVKDATEACAACGHNRGGKAYTYTGEGKPGAPATGRIGLSKAYSKYGASMGRGSDHLFGRVRVQRMRMSADGCYDAGGAYWGHANMFVAEDEYGSQAFVRAMSREDAKRALASDNPGITFAR